ncbi:hypothetical protein Plo01_05780 [Planobispora longispora]|uniref:non-specific serine/threonine protein kinase n=2 Tax=Planobispora longispora TaxID=28887 RepID=A0A8J3W2A7_9ACTN|nr:hypothetical protein Plo01_05780 [Planobispora longispora]
MGTVWRAQDEVLGRQVAVKEVVPSPDLTAPEREVFTVRTLREARAAGRIGHPGVATVYDVIEERGRPWIVMQLVDSRTLGAVIREDGPLTPYEVARIGLDVLGALVAAHRVGVLHRDVKPDNVLMATDGRAVLTDFGIAVLEGDSSVTRTGAIIGTPAFIAPERAAGGPAEFASDMWSLGVTLYMAIEGHSPFQRAHPLATLAAVMHDAPAPLRRAGALGPVICGLLRKDPAHRMSAPEVQRHLMAIVSGTAPEPTMPSVPIVPPAEAGPRSQAAPAAAPQAALSGVPQAVPPVPPSAVPPQPPVSGPGLLAGAVPRPGRRRSVIAATAAATVAVALTAGATAWITSKDAVVEPRKAPASVSVPSLGGESSEPADPRSTEDASGPPAETGASVPSSPPTSRGREKRTAEPSAKPSESASKRPSQRPSPDESGEGSGDGSENGSGDDGGEGTGQDSGGNGEDGGSPGQVDPGSGLNASGPGGSGEKVKAGKTVKAGLKGKGKGKG